MKNTIKAYILDNGMIVPGDIIWVAFSGGADSCCLLQILNELKTEMDFVLKAVHVNHLLRGDESDKDEDFCKNFCAKKGIELEVYYADVKQIANDRGMTIEQAGRSARYEIFNDKCAGKVAVAHNMNDNAETVLMNLLRGSGTAGLCGISNKTGKYIRPLLKTSREDIEKYCRDNKIDYINDSSNKDTIFYRNAIRHKVMPLLNDISGKNVVPVLDRAAGYIEIDNAFIDACADDAYSKLAEVNDFGVSIDNKGMKELHPALASRVARKAIEFVKGDLKDIEGRNTTILMNLILGNRTGNATNLPDGVNALVQFGKTIIYKEMPDIDFEYNLPIPGKIFVKEKNLYISAQLCTNAKKSKPGDDIHYFIVPVCRDGFSIRNRRNGDIIKPWKGVGTVKLKKYFIDRKIERHVRNNLILIACGESIAYIEKMEYGKEFLPGDSKEIVKVMFERR